VVALVADPIALERLLADLAAESDGAVALFVGLVRERNAGRRVVALTYDAWPEMALAELETIEREARAEHGATAARIVHRTGELGVGEVSVAIAVAAEHRAAAFAACRFAIEALKRRVPIWKKERYDDGSEAWIEGA
jgi:molybdopterin synthase catalytic subunit